VVRFPEQPESLYVLNDSPTGWTSEAARQAVGIGQYEHDPEDPHWGFTSWNDFFTRRFRAGQRPVAAPDDDKVIVSACESTPYNLRADVQQRDRFWSRTSRTRCRICSATTRPFRSSSVAPSTRRS